MPFKNAEDRKKYSAEYRKKNRIKIRAEKKEYYEENIESLMIKSKIYRKKHAKEISISKKLYYETNKEDINKCRRKNGRQYRAVNKAKIKAWSAEHYRINRKEILAKAKIRNWKRNAEIKLEVLSHYGPKGKPCCSWKGCDINDIDLLSLDHIENGGAKDRNSGKNPGGINGYWIVKRKGYPEGYQTLCHNHQWKKEILRRRAKRSA